MPEIDYKTYVEENSQVFATSTVSTPKILTIQLKLTESELTEYYSKLHIKDKSVFIITGK